MLKFDKQATSCFTQSLSQYFFFTMFFLSSVSGIAQQVKIKPEFPKRGEVVTIYFTPALTVKEDTTQINEKDTAVTMVFTYSNFYNVPYRLPMEKKGDHWEASFLLERYATYATFTLESGTKIQLPKKMKHYEVAVFNKDNRVKSGYLYESYSLSAQMGKDSAVPDLQLALLQKELEIYPDNYEAKVRLLHNKMNRTTGDEKEKYRIQALNVIAANFYKKPGDPGLRDKTTMGYLIIGEKTRVDSIHKVIRDKYPNTDAGYDMQVSEIQRLDDKKERKNKAEALLKKTPSAKAKFINELHETLMEYYVETKNLKKSLYHLNLIKADTTPYRGPALLKHAQLFLNNGMLLDTALVYTERAFGLAESFPAGLIRYWPETGYVLPYVSPSVKMQVVQTARANSLSLKALILHKKGDRQKAGENLSRALALSSDPKTLANAAVYYRLEGNYEDAYHLTKKLVMDGQEDTAAQRHMQEDYTKWKKNTDGWEKEMKDVTDHWRTVIMIGLKKERINKKLPVMERLVNIKGEPVPASAMEGKVVVIDFWATWCVPCMKEMPYLQAVYNRYKDNPKVLFMVVNSGSGNTLQDAQGWKGNKTYSFPVYYTDEKLLGERFGFNVIPSTFIVSPSGYIQFRNIGFEGPAIEYKLSTAIDLLLSE